MVAEAGLNATDTENEVATAGEVCTEFMVEQPPRETDGMDEDAVECDDDEDGEGDE